MWTEHPELEGWEDSDGIFYEKLPYAPEIIKAELTSRHPDDILVCGSESKDLSIGREYCWLLL